MAPKKVPVAPKKVSLMRYPSFSAGPAGSACPVAGPTTSSQAQDPGDKILEDMELAVMMQAAATTTTTCSKPQTKTSESHEEFESHEDAMVARLQANMEANNQLLRQVLQERVQPMSKKDAFLSYLDSYMRAAPEHEFEELQLMFYERICRPLQHHHHHQEL